MLKRFLLLRVIGTRLRDEKSHLPLCSFCFLLYFLGMFVRVRFSIRVPAYSTDVGVASGNLCFCWMQWRGTRVWRSPLLRIKATKLAARNLWKMEKLLHFHCRACFLLESVEKILFRIVEGNLFRAESINHNYEYTAWLFASHFFGNYSFPFFTVLDKLRSKGTWTEILVSMQHSLFAHTILIARVGTSYEYLSVLHYYSVNIDNTENTKNSNFGSMNCSKIFIIIHFLLNSLLMLLKWFSKV